MKTELLEITNFYDKNITSKVQTIFRKYGIRDSGMVVHRFLEAGRMKMKTDKYLEISVFFLPKYMKYLKDNYDVIDNCLKIMEHSSMPDIILYEKFPNMWIKTPWYEQVEQTIDFWKKNNLFDMEGYEDRLSSFKTLFDARQKRGETLVHSKEELSHELVENNIITKVEEKHTAYGPEFYYAFTHEYNKEGKLIETFNKSVNE